IAVPVEVAALARSVVGGRLGPEAASEGVVRGAPVAAVGDGVGVVVEGGAWREASAGERVLEAREGGLFALDANEHVEGVVGVADAALVAAAGAGGEVVAPIVLEGLFGGGVEQVAGADDDVAAVGVRAEVAGGVEAVAVLGAARSLEAVEAVGCVDLVASEP